jgi:hypothetical protein
MNTQERVAHAEWEAVHCWSLLAFRKGSFKAGRSSDVYISYSRVTASVNM